VDVSLTDEQQEWVDAVARLTADHSAIGADSLQGVDRVKGWRSVVDLGLPMMRTPDADGLPTGVECALAAEAVGRGLCPLPVLGQGLLVPELLAAAGATELLDEVANGRLRLAPALTDDLVDVLDLATGRTGVAFDAADATHALALDGSSLLVVELGAEALEGLDLTRELRDLDAGAPRLERSTGGAIDDDRLDRARAFACTMVAADLLGVMGAALEDAVAYVRERTQFGVAVGTFQAVQHLLADAAVAVEGARSCVWHAAWAVDHLPVDDALLAARTAKAYCSREGLKVVEAAVQAFGGIAITWEHTAHVRLRRTHLDRQCLGAEDRHLVEIADRRLRAVGAH